MKPLATRAAASGPLRLFAGARFLMLASARARRRAGPVRDSDGLPSLREGALRCSASWPVAELTSLAVLAAFRQAATSMSTKRAARAATRPALLGGAQSPRRRTTLGPTGNGGGPASKTNPVARKVAGGAWAGRIGAAEKRRVPGRARSALRALTGRILFERSEHSERSELCDRPQDRAPQGTRREAEGQHSERWRRTALGPAPMARRICNEPGRALMPSAAPRCGASRGVGAAVRAAGTRRR